MMRLKQICNHPSQWLGDGAYAPLDSGKFARLQEIVQPIAAAQQKVLLFTQYRELTLPLHAWLAGIFGGIGGEIGAGPGAGTKGGMGLVMHGGTPVARRQALVRQFQSDEQLGYFVLSLKVGGTGLNLTAASHVVHVDRWWNPAVEAQATDRAFRIGQKNPVMVHKLVCRGTLEEKIQLMLDDKRGLSDQLLAAGGEQALTEMDDRQLLATLQLDIHRAVLEA